MNELQIFNYSGNEIRTVQQGGEPWFVLKDVCAVLDIQNATDVAKRLDTDEVTRFNLGGLSGETNVINESGIYHVILRSDKPQAAPFRKWVTSEVLPTIRKTGGYVNDTSKFVDSYFPQLRQDQKQIIGLMLDESKRMGEKIAADAPKVLFADAVSTAKTSILIGELAKLLKQNGVDVGQNRLFDWLRSKGYLIRRRGSDYNMPTQRAMELGLFEIKETSIAHSDGHTTVNKTPKVTGRGQQYFVNKFLDK